MVARVETNGCNLGSQRRDVYNNGVTNLGITKMIILISMPRLTTFDRPDQLSRFSTMGAEALTVLQSRITREFRVRVNSDHENGDNVSSWTGVPQFEVEWALWYGEVR